MHGSLIGDTDGRARRWTEIYEKKKSASRGSAVKSKVGPKDVDEYLAGVPEPARSTLNKIRAVIRSVVPPEATEAISYQIPTFKYKGGLVAFAAFSKHCSFFPMSMAVMSTFESELKKFDSSKGTIRFPPDRPPSATLLKKMVKARLAEKERKK